MLMVMVNIHLKSKTQNRLKNAIAQYKDIKNIDDDIRISYDFIINQICDEVNL